MIELKDVSEWQPKSATYNEYENGVNEKTSDNDGDYLLVRRLIANNFDKWAMRQKIAIINALLDRGLEGDGEI